MAPCAFQTTTAQTIRLGRRHGELWVFEKGHRAAAIARAFSQVLPPAIIQWRYPLAGLSG